MECLKEAFAGESQANRRYSPLPRKPMPKVFTQIARLFRAAAAAETVHAHAHLRAMNGVGSTMDNLLAAIAGRGITNSRKCIRISSKRRRPRQSNALKSFKNAMPVEEVHHKLYSEAAETVKKRQGIFQKRPFMSARCAATRWW